MLKFHHSHYVPILKGKRAEPRALGALKSKTHLTPLIEAVPSRTPEQVPIDMAAQWPDNQRYFIDLLFLDDPDDETVPAQAMMRCGRILGRPRCRRGTRTRCSVASAKVTSWGEADAKRTPRGMPWPSANTMHFVPLPRFVLPTAEPPFSLEKRWRP